MPEPRTTPNEHDKPVFQPTTPGAPTPEDPRQREPIKDPPIDPEHDDIERENPVRQAGENDIERGAGTARSTDNIVFDENRKPG
jgi:hypothetical protein